MIQYSKLPNQNELERWREIVAADSTQFYDLCKELGAYPMVNQLYEWSNWRTPPGTMAKIFDTAFYITKIGSLPDYAAADGNETVHLIVLNPFEALKNSLTENISLYPPQFTEISRIAKFNDLNSLIEYASRRQNRGVKQWCPNQFNFKDCRVSAMTGDDLARNRNDGVDVSDEYSDQSLEENIEQCQNFIRTVWTYKINSICKNVYDRMWIRTNLSYFDSETSMVTPMDQTELELLLSRIQEHSTLRTAF